jgi:hypothetical protein
MRPHRLTETVSYAGLPLKMAAQKDVFCGTCSNVFGHSNKVLECESFCNSFFIMSVSSCQGIRHE